MAQIKCAECKVVMDKDEVRKKFKGKYYHVKCYENMLAIKYEERATEQKDPFKELKDYICNLFEIEELSALMENQINQYAKDYDLTYSMMLKALIYFFDLKEHTVTDAIRGIGIIPFVWKEAKEFYDNQEKRLEECKGADFSQSVKPVTVEIKPPKVNPYFNLFDIDKI